MICLCVSVDDLTVDVCVLLSFSLAGCNLTAQCCESLSSALQSSNSVLRELDLSNNDLQDSGLKFISDELKNLYCQLQILRYLRTNNRSFTVNWLQCVSVDDLIVCVCRCFDC